MTSPALWTPEEAAQMDAYLNQNPNDLEAATAMQTYLQSDARRKAAERPPEFHPPAVPGSGAMGFLKRLPESMGITGGTERWYEPSRDEMLAAFGGQLPPGQDEDGLLADYRNARWAQAYEEAKAKGRGIIRFGNTRESFDEGEQAYGRAASRKDAGRALSFLGGLGVGLPGLLGAGAKIAGDAVTTVEQFAQNLQPGRDLDQGIGGKTLGDKWRNEFAEAEASVDDDPTAIAAGLAGGIVSPWNKLGGATRGGGLLKGMVKSAGVGGVAAAGAGEADNLTRTLEDIVAGDSVSHAAGEMSDRALKNAPRNFLGGSALGAVAGAVGRLSAPLRSGELAPKIGVLEEAGGKTSFLKGVEYPKEITAAIEQTREPGAEPSRVLSDQFANKVAPQVIAKNHAILNKVNEQTTGYLANTQGVRIDPKPLAKAILNEATSRLSDVSGEALPLATAKRWGRIVQGLYEVIPVTSAKQLGNFSGDVQFLEMNKARALGLLPSATSEAVGTPQQTAATVAPGMRPPPAINPAAPAGALDSAIPIDAYGGRKLVALKRKQLSPTDIERLTKIIDQSAKVSSGGRKNVEASSFNRLSAAIRQTRDLFPANQWAPNGYSALKNEQAQALESWKQTLKDAGIIEQELGAGVPKALEESAHSFRQGPLTRDRAVEELAGDIPGARRSLFSIAATRDMPELTRSASLMRNMPLIGTKPSLGNATGLGTAALFHLDPILDPVARALRTGLPTALGAHSSAAEQQQLLELARQLQQQGQQ